jgi:hypothetical protein
MKKLPATVMRPYQTVKKAPLIMKDATKPKTKKKNPRAVPGSSPAAPCTDSQAAPPDPLDTAGDAASLVLTPGSALELLTRLIAEIPTASKETLDRLKLLDKLLNTARAMMETRLKTEEVSDVAARIDELELRIERMAMHGDSDSCRPREVWHDDTGEE